MNPFTFIVNTYFGVLAITFIGGMATLLILHVADSGTFAGFNPIADVAYGYGL